MNVLIINGSYHKQGMTAELVNSFKAGLLKVNPQAQVKVVDLLEQDVKFCLGCYACCKKDGKPLGECPQKDAMSGLLQEMLACDALVLAAPIYWLNYTALMQRFIERCMPLFYSTDRGPRPRNNARRGKIGVAIVSSGMLYPLNVLLGFTGHPVKIMHALCTYSGCAKKLSLPAGGMEYGPKVREWHNRRARALGEKVGRK